MWLHNFIGRPSYPSILFCMVTTLSFLILFSKFYAPVLFQYAVSYVIQLLTMAYNDDERFQNAEYLNVVQEYKLHEMEMAFNQQVCQSNAPPETNNAWLTAMMNDNYAIGAVYLGYVLRKLSCNHKMIALVSDGVSKISQEALQKVGFDVRVVEPLDCNWMDRRKGVAERNLGLPGTHMRFHAWNYTEYHKIVYLDPDVLPLNNLDELFSLKGELAASYCARPGLLDPCFNAGLLMFEPSTNSYNAIMDMWKNLSKGTNCPNDQVLLWHHYADHGKWVALPYAYNVRRYLYHPMKVYHFACCLTKKPWLVTNKPSQLEAAAFKGPFLRPEDMVTLWWKYFYDALDIYDLHDWYDEIKNNL